MNASLHQRSGEQALRAPDPPDVPQCDFCHAELSEDASYHCITIGMNEAGAPSPVDSVRTVEEVSELLVCKACYPLVDGIMDGFLERLWRCRKPELQGEPGLYDEAPETLPASLADTQPLPALSEVPS